MNIESHSIKSSTRRQKIIRSVFIVIALFFLFSLVKQLAENRCSIITCEPASWSKVQDLILDNTESMGTEYQLKALHIIVTDMAGLSKNDSPTEFVYIVNYVPTQERNDNFPGRYFGFDDKNLWVKKLPISSSYPTLPDMSREDFKKVALGPREIYKLTWDQADKILAYPIIIVSMKLSVDDKAKERFGIKPYWSLFFHDGENSVSFLVDAQSGKIVNTE